jgi:hypothetical protein
MPEASGAEIWIFPGSAGGRQLADAIGKQLRSHFPDEPWRGVKEEDLCVLRLTKMPAVLLSGCSGVLSELRQDPAIVGGTFTGLRISLTAAPGIPVPVPEIFIGRGTFYRIGGNRAVEVKAGDVTGAPSINPPEPVGGPPSPISESVQSEASMAIRAGETVQKPENLLLTLPIGLPCVIPLTD